MVCESEFEATVTNNFNFSNSTFRSAPTAAAVAAVRDSGEVT